MYLERYVSEMQYTDGIHAGYMQDTCICKGDQDTCGIHPRYIMRYMYLNSQMYLERYVSEMQDTCGIHA